MCGHRLAGDSLTCCRTDTHDETADGGHVYHSTSGVPEAEKEEA